MSELLEHISTNTHPNQDDLLGQNSAAPHTPLRTAYEILMRRQGSDVDSLLHDETTWGDVKYLAPAHTETDVSAANMNIDDTSGLDDPLLEMDLGTRGRTIYGINTETEIIHDEQPKAENTAGSILDATSQEDTSEATLSDEQSSHIASQILKGVARHAKSIKNNVTGRLSEAKFVRYVSSQSLGRRAVAGGVVALTLALGGYSVVSSENHKSATPAEQAAKNLTPEEKQFQATTEALHKLMPKSETGPAGRWVPDGLMFNHDAINELLSDSKNIKGNVNQLLILQRKSAPVVADADMLEAYMLAVSGGDSDAIGPDGRTGLFQVTETEVTNLLGKDSIITNKKMRLLIAGFINFNNHIYAALGDSKDVIGRVKPNELREMLIIKAIAGTSSFPGLDTSSHAAELAGLVTAFDRNWHNDTPPAEFTAWAPKAAKLLGNAQQYIDKLAGMNIIARGPDGRYHVEQKPKSKG